VTSENPVPKNNPSPNASGEAKQQKNDANETIPPTTSGSQLPPTEAHCQITCTQEKNWWDVWKPFVEMGGVILLALYTGYTIKQVHVSERSSRPFVGVDTFSIFHQWIDKDGKQHGDQSPVPQATAMGFRVFIKNYGPLPALAFKTDVGYYLDTIQEPVSSLPQQPGTLNPTQVTHMEGSVPPPIYRDVMNGAKVVTLHMTISYDGPEGHYKECNVQRYAPQVNAFLDVGPCPP
jgi:hypothetical protein